MDPKNSSRLELKAAILADSHSFLAGVQSGASDEQLAAILDRIKEQELRLTTEHGLKLSPGVWNILQSRLANRKPKDIINNIQDELWP